MDEDFIANETHQSDSRNYIELDESQTSNNEKNSDICGEKILEEYNLSLLLVNVFLVKKRLLFSIQLMQDNMVFLFGKVDLSQKIKK